jgi:hypothetical protein
MVDTATPGWNDGNNPPLYQVVGVKHNTAGGHSALRGALKARPTIVVDRTGDRALRGKVGREMF